jgi:hypothetical protein
MESSFDDTDSVGDQGDDGQLTIKIPNPKVYKARQSLWIGRRGKPRCDHCRLNNLKVSQPLQFVVCKFSATFDSQLSATVSSPLVIIAHGRVAEFANIRPYPPLPTVVFLDAIVVVPKTLKYVLPILVACLELLD